MAVNPPRLVSSHFPYLAIQFSVGLSTRQADALVDTGFDGDLVLPPGSIPGNLAPASHLLWALADDSEVLAPAYLGTVRLGDLGTYAVVITVLGDEAIIGRSLTNRFRLTFDHGSQIIVEL